MTDATAIGGVLLLVSISTRDCSVPLNTNGNTLQPFALALPRTTLLISSVLTILKHFGVRIPEEKVPIQVWFSFGDDSAFVPWLLPVGAIKDFIAQCNAYKKAATGSTPVDWAAVEKNHDRGAANAVELRIHASSVPPQPFPVLHYKLNEECVETEIKQIVKDGFFCHKKPSDYRNLAQQEKNLFLEALRYNPYSIPPPATSLGVYHEKMAAIRKQQSLNGNVQDSFLCRVMFPLSFLCDQHRDVSLSHTYTVRPIGCDYDTITLGHLLWLLFKTSSTQVLQSADCYAGLRLYGLFFRAMSVFYENATEDTDQGWKSSCVGRFITTYTERHNTLPLPEGLSSDVGNGKGFYFVIQGVVVDLRTPVKYVMELLCGADQCMYLTICVK